MERKLLTMQSINGVLLTLDIIGLLLAYYAAYAFRLGTLVPAGVLSATVFAFGALNILCLYLLNLYSLKPKEQLWNPPLRTLAAVSLAGCLIVLISYLMGAIEFSGLIGRGILIGSQAGFALWASASRFIVLKWVLRITQRTKWLAIGSEEILKPFIEDLKFNRSAGHFVFLTQDSKDQDALRTLDLINAKPGNGKPSNLLVSYGGTWENLLSYSQQSWSGVIVGTGPSLNEELVEILMTMRLQGSRVYDLADFYEETWSKVPVYYLQRSWFAMSQGFQLLHNPIGFKIKRLIDVLCAATLLLITSPVLALTALAIKLESAGPILFKQTRVGEGEKLFTVLKLRSMRTDAEKDGAQWASKNDSRVTRVGNFIRKTRIDELPQLINVLKGEMSFIGPRPERPEFTVTLESEIPFYNLRHIVRPGVTGWAQVMYPYGASVEDAREKLQFDLFYIKNYSLLLDAAIVLKTIRVVLFGQGR